MALKLGMVTFDTTDAVALAEWWAKAVDGQVTDHSGGWFVMVQAPDGLTLGFQKVADPTPGKNRLHLDMSGPDYATELERLSALGAKVVAQHKMEFGAWTVLEDPAGNQFCLGDPASM